MKIVVPDQALAAASAVREVLGAGARAVYLHSSATMRGLKPSSDLDLIAVSRRRSSTAEKLALARLLQPLSASVKLTDDLRPLELTVVAEPDFSPWKFPLLRDFQYGEWLRPSLDAGTANLDAVLDADLAVLIHMVRKFGHPIFGPPPSTILPEVPTPDLFEAFQQTVNDVLPGLRTVPEFALLTLARVWFTLETGAFTSKDDAGHWAAARLGPTSGSVLGRAARNFSGLSKGSLDATEAEISATADGLVRAIRTYGSVGKPSAGN